MPKSTPHPEQTRNEASAAPCANLRVARAKGQRGRLNPFEPSPNLGDNPFTPLTNSSINSRGSFTYCGTYRRDSFTYRCQAHCKGGGKSPTHFTPTTVRPRGRLATCRARTKFSQASEDSRNTDSLAGDRLNGHSTGGQNARSRPAPCFKHSENLRRRFASTGRALDTS